MIHRWPVRIYYEDVDLAGIVYYANYLKMIERARSEMVREAGIDQTAMRADGIVFAVRRVEADYLAPARYDDEVVIETWLGDVTQARFVMHQRVLRGETLLFEADVTIICMSVEGRPRRLPPEISAMVTKT